jgi:hypothetical protein
VLGCKVSLRRAKTGATLHPPRRSVRMLFATGGSGGISLRAIKPNHPKLNDPEIVYTVFITPPHAARQSRFSPIDKFAANTQLGCVTVRSPNPRGSISIDAPLEVIRALGPGFLEKVYKAALYKELFRKSRLVWKRLYHPSIDEEDPKHPAKSRLLPSLA